TRSFTGEAPASPGCDPLRQQLETRIEAVDVLAQRVHAAQELLTLLTRYQVRTLMTEVLADVLQQCCRRVPRPTQCAARQAADAMRRHIADEDRQLLFGIVRQQPRQLVEFLRELRIAPHLHLAA